MKHQVLLVDDSPQFINDFSFFTRNEFEVISTTSGKESLTHVRMNDPDVVLLDLKLSNGENGLEILRKIKNIDPDLPVIIITAYPDVDTAVEAMRLGAAHYTSKAPDLAALKSVIQQQIQALPWRRLYREEQEKKYGKLIGESPAMQKVWQLIDQCAATDLPVLIQGETGTGKELVANAIHRRSGRSSHMMLTINCSTLAANLFESEFFGHEKGAFTGAFARKRGKIELAEHGTLFLDEIADLPLESQPKILEAIEYKRFHRVGGEEAQQADVRFITATNKDLQHGIETGSFRQDLFYRLNVINIHLPPLRDRAEDIPELVQYFLASACRELNRPMPRVPADMMNYWKSYSWPGNIRELRHCMTRVAFETQCGVVSLPQLDAAAPGSSFNRYYQKLMEQPYQAAKQALLDKFQADYIRSALRRNNYNISKTAEEIGVHRSTVYRVMKGRNGNGVDED